MPVEPSKKVFEEGSEFECENKANNIVTVSNNADLSKVIPTTSAIGFLLIKPGIIVNKAYKY